MRRTSRQKRGGPAQLKVSQHEKAGPGVRACLHEDRWADQIELPAECLTGYHPLIIVGRGDDKGGSNDYTGISCTPKTGPAHCQAGQRGW